MTIESPERKVLKEMLVKLKAKVISSQNLFCWSITLNEHKNDGNNTEGSGKDF